MASIVHSWMHFLQLAGTRTGSSHKPIIEVSLAACKEACARKGKIVPITKADDFEKERKDVDLLE